MSEFMAAALAEAEASIAEGGLPIGSVIVAGGRIVGAGRNRYRQTGDPTAHAEMEAIRDAARRAGGDRDALLRGATCYTTMMPCEMCTGAIIRFELGRVVVAETRTYVDAGTRPLLERQGIAVEVLDDPASIRLVESYLEARADQAAVMRATDRRRLRL